MDETRYHIHSQVVASDCVASQVVASDCSVTRITSSVRGYHSYKDVWHLTVGDV